MYNAIRFIVLTSSSSWTICSLVPNPIRCPPSSMSCCSTTSLKSPRMCLTPARKTSPSPSYPPWRPDRDGLSRTKIFLSFSFPAFVSCCKPTCNTLYHFLLSFGLPLTVLCQTMGKFVFEQKFWVTATVVSRLSTTCQKPLGTNTVSPGCWINSS
jgi:hypothetical protein